MKDLNMYIISKREGEYLSIQIQLRWLGNEI
jgi:hypothetical protein